MKKALNFLVLLLFLFVTSCVTTDTTKGKCSVKSNKKKFAYYNSIQFGASKPYVKKKNGFSH